MSVLVSVTMVGWVVHVGVIISVYGTTIVLSEGTSVGVKVSVLVFDSVSGRP